MLYFTLYLLEILAIGISVYRRLVPSSRGNTRHWSLFAKYSFTDYSLLLIYALNARTSISFTQNERLGYAAPCVS